MKLLWILLWVMPCLVCAQITRSPTSVDVYNEQRVALVIGNGAYGSTPLLNPPNDAEDIANVLRACKFRVFCVINADKKEMGSAIEQLGRKLTQGGIGLFYYSGHGAQRGGKNYLFPVGMEIRTAQDIEDKTVGVNQVLSVMEKAGNRLNMIILDACRNNPYLVTGHDSAVGLVTMKAPAGTLIAFATADGKTAAEGPGRNGVYTKYLLEQIGKPGLKVEEMFKAVRVSVKTETRDQQIPFDYSSLTGDFYFTPIDFNEGKTTLTDTELKQLRQREENQCKIDEDAKVKARLISRMQTAAVLDQLAEPNADFVDIQRRFPNEIHMIAGNHPNWTQMKPEEFKASATRLRRKAAMEAYPKEAMDNQSDQFVDPFVRSPRLGPSLYKNAPGVPQSPIIPPEPKLDFETGMNTADVLDQMAQPNFKPIELSQRYPTEFGLIIRNYPNWQDMKPEEFADSAKRLRAKVTREAYPKETVMGVFAEQRQNERLVAQGNKPNPFDVAQTQLAVAEIVRQSGVPLAPSEILNLGIVLAGKSVLLDALPGELQKEAEYNRQSVRMRELLKTASRYQWGDVKGDVTPWYFRWGTHTARPQVVVISHWDENGSPSLAATDNKGNPYTRETAEAANLPILEKRGRQFFLDGEPVVPPKAPEPLLDRLIPQPPTTNAPTTSPKVSRTVRFL